MDNLTISSQKRIPTLITEIWLNGVLISFLIALGNLIFFLILDIPQLLAVSAGAILSAGLFLLSQRVLRKGNLLGSATVGTIAWVLLIIVHQLFLANALILLLVSIWLFPVIWFLGLPSGIKRLLIFIPVLIGILVIILLEINRFFAQILVTDFLISRFLAPYYFFVLGVFVFLLTLRGLSIRLLSTRLITSMIAIVFIPIVVISMVTYTNTKLNDSLAATSFLEITASQKGREIESWSTSLSGSLSDLLSTSGTYDLIIELLSQPVIGTPGFSGSDRVTLTETLTAVREQNGFEEIILMDEKGTVVASTRSDMVGVDNQYLEFFWQGKQGETIITPRYYPAENEVSLFISRPVRNQSGEVVGVISGRATIARMLDIITDPIVLPFHTTRAYLIGTDGGLLANFEGRPNTSIQMSGAEDLLSQQQNGSASYTSANNVPVIGYYLWIPSLKIGVLVEASQSEVYERLPGIVAVNIAIGILAFLLATVAAISIVSSITNPINALVKASQDVVGGNLDSQVQINRDDELGILTEGFNKMTGELKVLVAGLESRVSERTRDLEKRSVELQTAAQIARVASLASNMDDLLSKTARLIRERFGYYHVGIFIIDDNNEYAFLRAAAGDAGQIMLANKHKLKVGETGIVGEVSRSGEARIALDVGVDSFHFRNPLLPYTRSEMALPLKNESAIIGILDVQSDRVRAFDQNDITIMSILTDQLAIAIARTRLLQDSIQSSASMENALQSQTARDWKAYLSQSSQIRGYRYEGIQVEALKGIDLAPLAAVADSRPTITPAASGADGCTASIPIKLRGQPLGVITINFSVKQISDETMRLLEEAGSRLSLALENVRLIQDSRRLATQEQQINYISGQIQNSTDMDSILQNTIKELGKVLGVPKTFIQIGFSEPQETGENQP